MTKNPIPGDVNPQVGLGRGAARRGIARRGDVDQRAGLRVEPAVSLEGRRVVLWQDDDVALHEARCQPGRWASELASADLPAQLRGLKARQFGMLHAAIVDSCSVLRYCVTFP